jgi:hypothetical protein
MTSLEKVAPNATLPSEYRPFTVADLGIGASGWVVPWALIVDSENRMWINPRHTVASDRQGMSSVFVSRWHDGYHVTIDEPEIRYVCRIDAGSPDAKAVVGLTIYEAEKK